MCNILNYCTNCGLGRVTEESILGVCPECGMHTINVRRKDVESKFKIYDDGTSESLKRLDAKKAGLPLKNLHRSPPLPIARWYTTLGELEEQ